MHKNNTMVSSFQDIESEISFKKANDLASDAIVRNFCIFVKSIVNFGYYFHASE
ncbi:hypothetical protein LEP1GSC172_2570 [Leptospira noguchii]|uniref:Uncharacterized protein n=2 Tax=Leptospira noguchii TaxID=28182 RepID=M6V9W0_9LEPT|nr:hypothetical protein LEP1GSC172_2570 [Leptospira noguchii]